MPKKRLQGVVVSDKMQKTVVVKVERQKFHPKFKVYYRVHKKYKAHDEKNECRVGDWVIIEETRPLSKEKKWRVIEIIRREEAKEEKEGERIVTNNEDKEEI
ncbi:MAG: 30S ribosomal protein S17 [Candidatus Pacebacteria bacterium]|nr:30S ribosomal protein S17 [Candidatus Paceibacterota bacterium]